MQQQVELESKYPFLKVRKEKESILMGINPTNRHQHELLKMIKTLNTVQNVGKGMLFTVKQSVLEQLQIEEKVAISNLNSMVQAQLCAQILCFEYDQPNKQLNVVPFYIAHPPEDKNYNIYNIFDETIVYSYNAIKAWFDTRDQITRDTFKKELQSQFSTRQTEVNQYKGPSSLFNPLKRFQENRNPITISDEMIEYVSRELIMRLVETLNAREIPGHGLLLLKQGEVLDHFEGARDFMEEKLIPSLIADPNIKHRLDRIIFEEEAYYKLERFPVKTTKFIAMKATEIKQIKSSGPRGSIVYPGSLCVETLIKLEEIAEDRYVMQWREECNRARQEFKSSITIPTNKWQRLVAFISQSECINFHPDVWRDITNDKDLYYIKWQLPKNTMHIFTGKDANLFKVIISGMIHLPPNEIWKASAVRNIIEKNSKDFRKLMTDPNFLQLYQNLERKIYMHYMPWYYRIFLYFPLFIFQDFVLVFARKNLAVEQEVYSNKNEAYNMKFVSDLESDRQEKLTKLKEESIFESMIQILDMFYLTLKKIPSVTDVKQYFTDYETFMHLLTARKFKIVNFTLKNNEDVEALLYPEDDNWSTKKSQIMKALDQIVNEKNPHIALQDKTRTEKAQKLIAIVDPSRAKA